MIDQALDRLRRHVESIGVLAEEMRAPDANPAALGDRLARSARDAGEDVETLRILAVTTPAEREARPAPPPPNAEASGATGQGEAPTSVFSAPDQDPHALWADTIAAHDRDHADDREGIPSHRAGERPDLCSACEVFAALGVGAEACDGR